MPLSEIFVSPWERGYGKMLTNAYIASVEPKNYKRTHCQLQAFFCTNHIKDQEKLEKRLMNRYF